MRLIKTTISTTRHRLLAVSAILLAIVFFFAETVSSSSVILGAHLPRAADSESPVSSASSQATPQGGCPSTALDSISCPDGQTSYYIPQSNLQCAHYECQDNSDSSTTSNSSSSGGSDGKTSTIVLAAVLGTVLPLIAIGTGIFFFLHRRNKGKRSADAQHNNAKFMSRYDSLDGNAFGGGDLHMSDAYSSTYSVSKWRDSALQIPGSPGSHASIPIIFSAEYSLDQLNSNGAGPSINRETRLYNATAASDETQQWATPNVVNIKQKPQLVVLGATSPSTSVPLEINTTNIRDKQPESETNAGVASASDEESPATPLSPETPVSMTSITKASAPAKTQMPRIVQIGNPQATRALEATTQQPQLAPGSPLRAMTHGWDSESDLSDSGESEAESFAPATGTSRPESQVDNKNITRLTLGAGLPFGGDGEDSFSKEVLGATGSIGLGNENTKS